MLATLTAAANSPGHTGDRPLTQPRKAASIWDDDGLADDVATLSYEQALRSHSGYHAVQTEELAVPMPARNFVPEARHPACAQSAEKKRQPRSIIITVRVSEAECAVLRQRAAEAGLTVSAYLRSCTFEAESLRAMVKETLAKMRSAQAEARPVAATPRSHILGWPGRAARWMTPWRRAETAVRA